MSNILNIPFKENKKLKAILDFIDGNAKLQLCGSVQIFKP